MLIFSCENSKVDLPWGQGLWLQQNWEVWHVSSTIEPPSRKPTNWRTIIPKKFSHCCESSRVHSRFPNLGIRKKNWEPLGNLTLKASLDSYTELTQDFPCGAAGKESACNVGDLGSIPGLGRSPGERKGYPLQYSSLENSMNCISVGSQIVGHDWATFTFHRTGETDSWRAQTKPCVHQDPGERRSDPTGDWARLAYECAGVSSGDLA